jgi:hypothetical protein
MMRVDFSCGNTLVNGASAAAYLIERTILMGINFAPFDPNTELHHH